MLESGEWLIALALTTALVLALGSAASASAADCWMDACVECQLRNGHWVCKIIFFNAYCDCDSLSGGCSQYGECEIII